MFLVGCIIYFVVLSIAIGLIAKAKHWWKLGDMYGVVISAVIVIVWGIIGAMLFSTNEVPYNTIISKYGISAFRDSLGTQGQGGIIYIDIRPGLGINYLQNNEDGSVSPKSLKSSVDIKIFEGDYDPRLEYKAIKYRCEATTLRRMFVGPCQIGGTERYWYEAYVPRGTVVGTFEVDLQ
jgi:hypothetical protein